MTMPSAPRRREGRADCTDWRYVLLRGAQVYKRRCASRFMWSCVTDPDFPSERRSGVDNVHALITAQARAIQRPSLFPSQGRHGACSDEFLCSWSAATEAFGENPPEQADLAAKLCIELSCILDMCSARAHFGMRDLRRILGYILDASSFFRHPIFCQRQEASKVI
jgi:hypothetical protein